MRSSMRAAQGPWLRDEIIAPGIARHWRPRPRVTNSLSNLKLQAPSLLRYKRQASSPELQASSSKPQASSSMILEPRNIWKRLEHLGPRASAMIKVLCGCLIWNANWCGLNLSLLPFVTFNSIVKKWPLLLLANTSGVPRLLRFSSLVREKSLQDLRNFW